MYDPWRSEQNIRSPGTEVRNGCKLPCGYWKPGYSVRVIRFLAIVAALAFTFCLAVGHTYTVGSFQKFILLPSGFLGVGEEQFPYIVQIFCVEPRLRLASNVQYSDFCCSGAGLQMCIILLCLF